VGDAFETNPAWAGENAALWASAARLGLVSMGGEGFTAAFDHVRVSRLRPGSIIPSR
jgi:hypothetical protein